MKIIVVGCGRQGTDLAQVLDKAGHRVTVIDPDPEHLARLDTTFGGRIIEGVVFDRDVLIDAGIERTDGLAAMTNSDDANIVTALLARNVFKVPQVVARIYDPRQRDIYGRLGLRTISPVEIGTTHIVSLLVHAKLETLSTLGSGELLTVQTQTPVLLIGRTVRQLTVPGEICVVAIIRQGRAFIPTLGTEFAADDLIVLSVMSTATDRLNQLLGLD